MSDEKCSRCGGKTMRMLFVDGAHYCSPCSAELWPPIPAHGLDAIKRITGERDASRAEADRLAGQVGALQSILTEYYNDHDCEGPLHGCVVCKRAHPLLESLDAASTARDSRIRREAKAEAFREAAQRAKGCGDTHEGILALAAEYEAEATAPAPAGGEEGK